MSRNIALIVEYDGTRFAGFQRQSNAISIQGELESAIRALTGRESKIRGAGRTDAGVHATGQVVAFWTDSILEVVRFRYGLNHYLPSDIAILEACEVENDFDPRRDALSRIYRYTVLVRDGPAPLRRFRAQIVDKWPDLDAMMEVLGYIEGERDFAPFSGDPGTRKTTIRRLDRAFVWQEKDEIIFEIEASGFLPQQVRRTVAAALNVGLGNINKEKFKELADSQVRGAAHWVLPARGLCLQEVKYKNFPPRDHARSKDNKTYATSPLNF